MVYETICVLSTFADQKQIVQRTEKTFFFPSLLKGKHTHTININKEELVTPNSFRKVDITLSGPIN